MSEALAKKLRLTLEEPLVVLNRPDLSYFADFTVSEELPTQPVERIILFVHTLAELKKAVLSIYEKQQLVKNGRLLICYPKKGNAKGLSFIHRDDIFPALKVHDKGLISGTDFKFNQMVKLDDTYTVLGIKRIGEMKPQSSQPTVDYQTLIPTLIKRLENDNQLAALIFFKSLTPGYQKGWARYIYSAKREVTQEKRYLETVNFLEKGIKSKDLA